MTHSKETTKVCPSCQARFTEDTRMSLCPSDGTLLCPIDADDLTGTIVGDYAIVSALGQGTSGQVYLAYNQTLDIKAAVKFQRCSLLSDPAAVKRFQQESQTIQTLTHENITALYDYGVTDDGRPYIIMEYVNGETLSQRLASIGSMSPDSVTAMFVQVASAMQEAHLHGILHRDLKPSNLMLDEHNNVKVVDFGVAKVASSESAATLTRTGINLGTPAYMSPEQCFGRKLDGRSDIYSLGCVMYECLTGRPVFPDDNAFTCMHRHAFEMPLALSKWTKSVSPHLQSVVLKCLQKDPKFRFQSMDDLKSALRGRPISELGGISPPRKKQAALLLVAAALCSIALPVVISSFPFREKGGIERVPTGFKPIIAGQTVPIVDLNDIRPVAVRAEMVEPVGLLMEWFKDVDEEIRWLTREGKSSEAANMKRQLNVYREMLTGKYPSSKSQANEIHAVGLHSGEQGSKVRVAYTGAPITLILSAYNSVNWRVTVDPGVKLTKVILTGYNKQFVNGIDKKVKVVDLSGDSNSHEKNLGDPYVWHRDIDIFNQAVKRSQGSEVNTFIGAYESNESLVVGPSNMKWRAQNIMSRMKKFYEQSTRRARLELTKRLDNVTFDGVWVWNELDKYNTVCTLSAIGKITPRGPRVNTLSQLNYQAFTGVPSTSDKNWYLTCEEGLMQYDVTRNKTGSLLSPPNVDLQSVHSIAYDTKRDILRLLVNNHLYAYDKKKKSWTGSANGPLECSDPRGMCYSPKDDCLFVMGIDYSNGDDCVLLQIDNNGQFISKWPLAALLGTLSDQIHIQLGVYDRFVVGIANSKLREDGIPNTTVRSFAVDRFNGRVFFIRDLPRNAPKFCD